MHSPLAPIGEAAGRRPRKWKIQAFQLKRRNFNGQFIQPCEAPSPHRADSRHGAPLVGQPREGSGRGSLPLPASLPLARPAGAGLPIFPPPCGSPCPGCGSPPLHAGPGPSSRAAAKPPCLPSPPFSHLLRPDRETCLFCWLIVKGFDLQLTPGQDFLSTNPALFKHKNALPSSLASVILIPPALTPCAASASRLHLSELGEDAGAAGPVTCQGIPTLLSAEPLGTQSREGGGRAASWPCRPGLGVASWDSGRAGEGLGLRPRETQGATPRDKGKVGIAAKWTKMC